MRSEHGVRVESIELHRIAIPFKTAFRHAMHERTATDAVIVAIGGEGGRFGYGEVLPRPYVTGETIERALDEIAPPLARSLIGRRFAEKREVVGLLLDALDRAGRDLATLSGFEIALLDLCGRALGFSIGEVLGGSFGEALPAGVVIGFEIETKALQKYCAVLRLSGKRHIKVKVGLPDDLDRLQMISHAFQETPLRLDANGAYTGSDQAILSLEAMKACGIPIASVEQPLAADDHAGHRRIREATHLRVMADESLVTIEDAQTLIRERAADIFNVRLGKCGGVLASKRIVEEAKRASIGINLGTLVGETGILSRAAEIFGRAVQGFECLDGKGQNDFLLCEDVLENPREPREADVNSPGLGVTVSRERLAKHAKSAPVVFS
jgi:L-Ala-D/L-Glu epimerase / N-acetyl-D-glutamate racemase